MATWYFPSSNPKPQLTRVDEKIEVVRYSAPKCSLKGDSRNFLVSTLDSYRLDSLDKYKQVMMI